MTDPRTNKDINKGPVLREHTFDGIEEYDQKLPNWWLFTFYIAIVLYIVYWLLMYSTGLIKPDSQVIDEHMAKIEQVQKAELEAMLANLDDQTLITWSQNGGILAEGEEIYKANCLACHGAGLEGGIGRPLNADKLHYGNKPMELFNIVLNGSPADAVGYNGQKMQAWKQLGPDKVAKVVAFVASKNDNIKE
ncbi:cbb3-type cytochrome c oxidase N-terminal domain-containing protein [Persicirhabdus sediminis]|uniref:C-type cytochrome n=1 Tax=Persicirhabdus sediminis TaxID=454144 RepID=A0A8J7MC89_9BACT|nr:cbb3-type cytochrome c oxidase N-terminal domain-containing protein [Persicirhabdus sediminis]MBK1789815.1 c-type cytochrome [Persicirhabdus sediminis]